MNFRCLAVGLLYLFSQVALSVEPVLTHGTWKRLYTPPERDGQQWWLNDHTFIRGNDGRWHFYGITAPQPDRPRLATLFDDHAWRAMSQEQRNEMLSWVAVLREGPSPIDTSAEIQFAHAVNPRGPDDTAWETQPFPITVRPEIGESVLWAPHVVHWNDRYYMFYCAGGDTPQRFGIRLAISDDLQTWQRHGDQALFEDGYEARDPMVLRVGEQWVMYYTATEHSGGGRHIVAYRTSRDLLNWGPRSVAFVDQREGTGGGPTESPFVVARNGHYYLFLAMRRDYVPGAYRATEVFVSDTPYWWAGDTVAATVDAHAAEVMVTASGQWYVSHSGWYQGGVYLAPLYWHDQAKEK